MSKVSGGFQWLESDSTGDPTGVRRARDGKEFDIPRLSDDGSSLVSGDGIPNSLSVGAIQGFSAATTIPEIVFDQSKGGQYLFTAYDAGNNYTSSLSVATGTLASMTKTAIAAANVSNLKDTAGAAIASANAGIGVFALMSF